MPRLPTKRPLSARLEGHGPNASEFFPAPEHSGPEGLVGIGGSLEPAWLLDAYRHGIFPWPDGDYEPLLWWSPDPRAIIELGDLHVSKRLQRTLKSNPFRVSYDEEFAGVIDGCSSAPGRRGATWLTRDMLIAYKQLHALGHAHSVEVWSKETGQLAGGVYGVAIGGVFAAESMFHRVTDASKVALVHLERHLIERGYQLWDIQQWTEHTGRMGAIEIPRAEYLERLAAAVTLPVTFR